MMAKPGGAVSLSQDLRHHGCCGSYRPVFGIFMSSVEKSRAYLPDGVAELCRPVSTHAQNIAVIWHKLTDAGIEDLTRDGRRRWRPNHWRLAAE